MAAAVAAHSMAQLRYDPAVSTGRSVNRTESPIQKLLQSGERSGNGYPFGPARGARKVAGRAGGPYPKSRNSIQKAQCTKTQQIFLSDEIECARTYKGGSDSEPNRT
jgi:hypothetical protein